MNSRDLSECRKLQSQWDKEEASAERKQRRIVRRAKAETLYRYSFIDASMSVFPMHGWTRDGRRWTLWQHVDYRRRDEEITDEERMEYCEYLNGECASQNRKGSNLEPRIKDAEDPELLALHAEVWLPIRHFTGATDLRSVVLNEDLCVLPTSAEGRAAADAGWSNARRVMLAQIDALPSPSEEYDFRFAVKACIADFLGRGIKCEIRERLIEHGPNSFDRDWCSWLARKAGAIAALLSTEAVACADDLLQWIEWAVKSEACYRDIPSAWQGWTRSQRYRFHLRINATDPARFLVDADITRVQRLHWLSGALPGSSKVTRRIEGMLFSRLTSHVSRIAA